MPFKKENKREKNSHKSLTILIVLFVMGLVVLSMLLYFGGGDGGGTSANQDDIVSKILNNQTQSGTGSGGQNQNKSVSNVESKAILSTPSPSEAQSQNGAGNSGGSSDGGVVANTQEVAQQNTMKCSQDLGTLCFVTLDGGLGQALDNDPFSTGAVINGSRVVVSKIEHQMAYKTLPDNRVGDAQGSILASTQVTYIPSSKTLQIVIGVDKKYYESLTYSDQRTLYISQLVRAIFSVTEELPSNYPKVLKTVGRLNSWDPNTNK